MDSVDSFDLQLEFLHKVHVHGICATVRVSMLRDLFFDFTYKLVMSVCKLRVLAYIFTSFNDSLKLVGVVRVVLDEGVVFLVEHLENYLGIGEGGELDCLFEKAYPPLLECHSSISLITDFDDLNFLAAHKEYIFIFDN